MKNYIIIIMLLAMAACAKEEITPREYPRVRTISISAPPSKQVVVVGEITHTSGSVLEHGFVLSSLLSNTTVETKDRLKVSLGEKKNKGKFTYTFQETRELETTYYIRAYVKTATHVVYGEEVTFLYKKEK